jgi:hypothetical protein
MAGSVIAIVFHIVKGDDRLPMLRTFRVPLFDLMTKENKQKSRHSESKHRQRTSANESPTRLNDKLSWDNDAHCS